MPGKFHTAPVLRNLLFLLATFALAIVPGYLAIHHAVQRDLTFNAYNSLDPASVDVLSKMEGPVTFTAYATEQDPKLGDVRKIIRDFLSLYQRYKPDIKLVFVDPAKEEGKARAAQVRLNGEMVVDYAGRSEHVTKIDEQTVTSTLLRLAHSRNQVVMYLSGHGERKLDGIANFDLGTLFGARLKQNGFHIASLNLALAQEVPDNVSVLVITQPQLDLLPGEVDKLLHYIDRGGNLLWLIDPGPLYGLQRLATRIHVILPPGIIVDPAASQMNAPATWALGTSYPPHAITGNFNLITAYPSARPLVWDDTSLGKDEVKEWQHQALVEVAPRGWASRQLENGKTPNGKIDFDKQHDLPGPLTVALALQRNVKDREQRIVVVGNNAFLDNSYAGNGGNVTLGLNMVNWLASEEKLITLPPHTSRDSNLVLSKSQLRNISIVFLIGLPLLLAGTGGFIWWKRRRG